MHRLFYKHRSKQSTPPLTLNHHQSLQQHENAPPGSTNTLGFIAPGGHVYLIFQDLFMILTRFIYA